MARRIIERGHASPNTCFSPSCTKALADFRGRSNLHGSGMNFRFPCLCNRHGLHSELAKISNLLLVLQVVAVSRPYEPRSPHLHGCDGTRFLPHNIGQGVQTQMFFEKLADCPVQRHSV